VDGYYNGKGPNPIVKISSDDLNTSSASVEMSNIFQGNEPTDVIESISFMDPSDSVAQSKQVTKVRAIINGNLVLDDVTLDQMTAHLKESDMTPTVGAYNWVLDHDEIFESMRLIRDIKSSQFTLTLKAASAGTIRRIIQKIGDPTL